MPIPAVASHDVFLRALLNQQVKGNFDAQISVEAVIKDIRGTDTHGENTAVPSSVREDIEYLERLRLVEFYPRNPHVRLTPMGVYTALLLSIENEETHNTAPTILQDS